MTRHGGYLWGPALALSVLIACAEDTTTGPSSGTGSPASGGLTASASCAAVTQVCPGESIQAAVNASPAGATLTIATGIHRKQTIVPKTGMTFVGEPGAVLDGEQAKPYAFDGSSKASGVTIRGLEVRNYVPANQYGAINGARGGTWTTSGWLVVNCNVHHNVGGGGMGVKIGNNWTVRANNLHHNDQYGIGGKGLNSLVEGNEIAFNNYLGRVSTRRAGGTKFAGTRNLVIRDNFVHDNRGNGFWLDGNGRDVLIEGNTIAANARQGVMVEIGYSVVIRGNTVRGNGTDPSLGNWLYGAGIMAAHSEDVEVVDNLVEDNLNGIVGIQQNRSGHELRNLWVHDNVVRMERGYTGVGKAGKTNLNPYAANNRFDRNTYHLGRNSRYFKWKSGSVDEAGWRAAGQDKNGTFLR